MLLKTTIKLLLAGIWVSLFNFIPLVIITGIQSQSNKDEFQYILNFLYNDSFKSFPISILLLIIGLLLFLIADYFYEKHNPDKSIMEIVKTYLSCSFAITVFLGLLTQIGLGMTYIPKLIWVFVIKIPFVRGWNLLFYEKISYFNYPTIMSLVYSGNSGENEFIYVLILSFFYLLCLYSSFYKESKSVLYKKWDKEKEMIFKIFSRIYLIYLTPAIFVWIYPIILKCFNLLPNDSYPIRKSHIVGFCFFLVALFFVVRNLIKNNKKVKRELLKEEIKKELIEEFDKK